MLCTCPWIKLRSGQVLDYTCSRYPLETFYAGQPSALQRLCLANQVSCGEDGYPTVKHKSSLAGHTKTVNSVRFSPTGTVT